MKTSFRWSSVLVACGLFVVSARCGGGDGLNINPDAGPTPLSGVVVKGRVSGATVTAYALSASAISRDRQLASTVAGEDGSYALTLAYRGHVLLVASGGSYVDEATGAVVHLGSSELTAVVLDYDPTAVRTASINPITHLEAVLATSYIESRALPVAEALQLSRSHLDEHFLGVPWSTVLPVDLTTEPRSAQMDAEARAGLVLAALSWQAQTISTAAGLSGTSQVTAMTLVDAYARDLAGDGYFDGLARAEPIIVPAGGTVSPTGPTAYRMSDATARAHLALALQRFVASERNVTAIELRDVDAVGNTMARNSNPSIFRSGGSELDTAAADVTFTVSFSPRPGASSGPVGPEALVRGVVTVTATASDPSGMQSLALNVAGAPLAAAPQGNSPTLYVGTWDTTLTPDGALTVTAVTRDNAATPNEGTASVTVHVDNTAPAISVTSPAAGAFHSAAADVLADATDASGILRDSFTVAGLATFGDSDASDGRVAGTWNIAAAAAVDGAVTATFRVCDLVENCTTVTRGFFVDRTPPLLEIVQPPPQYTAAATAYVRVAATDNAGAGVGAVYLSVDGTPVEAAEESTGVYGGTVPLGSGRNTITVWAVDRALATGNTGFGRTPPHQRLVTTTYDTVAPVPTNVIGGGKYRSEQNIGIAESSPGRPAIPVSYTGIGAEELLSFGSTLYKASTRLGWAGVTPSASELASTNLSNTPFLRFEAYFSAENDAPFTSVAYSIDCSACGTGGTATGQLLPAGEGSSSQFLQWVLPLNAATVPMIGYSRTSPVTLDITVRITDAAGRVGAVTGSVTMHIVSPPISWVEETNYPLAQDPQSVFQYRLSNGTYDNLFDAANPNFPNDAPVRVVRYVLRNPFSVPVVVQLAPLDSGDWTLLEDWNNDVYDPTNPNVDVPYSRDGFSFPTRAEWADKDTNDTCATTIAEHPCSGFASQPHAVHGIGDTSTKFTCVDKLPGSGVGAAPDPAAQNVGGAGWDTLGYSTPQPAGNELQLATQYSVNGRRAWRVPAASGINAGEVVVYVVVPRIRTSAPPLTIGTLPGRTADRPRYHYRDFWGGFASTTTCTVEPSPDCLPHGSPLCQPQPFGSTTYERRYWYRQLMTAQFSMSGSLQIKTLGTYDDGIGSFPVFGTTRDFATSSFTKSLDFNSSL